jgi:hypothetical protein
MNYKKKKRKERKKENLWRKYHRRMECDQNIGAKMLPVPVCAVIVVALRCSYYGEIHVSD